MGGQSNNTVTVSAASVPISHSVLILGCKLAKQEQNPKLHGGIGIGSLSGGKAPSGVQTREMTLKIEFTGGDA